VATQILALYDRSALGDLAVETAFQLAGEQSVAGLHILAVTSAGDDAAERETLADDLIMFARIATRHGVALDGAVIGQPTLERLTEEVRKRRIDHLVIAKPLSPHDGTDISRLLETVAHDMGLPATVVPGGP
jgi:hypothetical protein